MSLALLSLLPSLLATAIATEQDIATIIKAFNPGMTDAELNAVCALVVAGATRHKALADADAGVKP